MDQNDLFYLGRILKRHGHQGAVMAMLEVDEPHDYKELKSVYVEVTHERIPFFIESVEILEKNRAVLKFEGVSSADHADAFAGHNLYLPLDTLPKLEGNRFYFHEVKGFRITDESAGEIGFVEDILELPHQALFQVRKGSREILIPVVDEVIVAVDRAHRTIHIRAPEGLIDLYLR